MQTVNQRLAAMRESAGKYWAPGKQSDGEAALAFQIATNLAVPVPEAEYAFAAQVKRRWRFDFAWPEHGLAVEVEGNGSGGHAGRHRSWDGFRADAEKYNTAAMLGWTVLRFTTDQVEAMAAAEAVAAFFAGRTRKAAAG